MQMNKINYVYGRPSYHALYFLKSKHKSTLACKWYLVTIEWNNENVTKWYYRKADIVQQKF